MSRFTGVPRHRDLRENDSRDRPRSAPFRQLRMLPFLSHRRVPSTVLYDQLLYLQTQQASPRCARSSRILGLFNILSGQTTGFRVLMRCRKACITKSSTVRGINLPTATAATGAHSSPPKVTVIDSMPLQMYWCLCLKWQMTLKGPCRSLHFS